MLVNHLLDLLHLNVCLGGRCWLLGGLLSLLIIQLDHLVVIVTHVLRVHDLNDLPRVFNLHRVVWMLLDWLLLLLLVLDGH